MADAEADAARHVMRDGPLAVTVLAQGAEPCSLHHASAGEMLWQAGPAWPRHAPVLFPVVGRLNGDVLRHAGQVFRMTQHGFARDRRFEWLARDAASCRLVLCDDAASRAAFPFPFRLEVGYRLDGAGLHVMYDVTNPGEAALPVSIGAHPAFRWPLAPGVPPEAHRLVFAADEPAPVRRLQDGLLRAEPEPTPVCGRVLALAPALFEADALILDHPASRSLRYEAPGCHGLELGWDGFVQLGLWSRAGAEFVCIEPWHGLADAVGFAGEVSARPGGLLLAPGETRRLGWRVRVLPPA